MADENLHGVLYEDCLFEALVLKLQETRFQGFDHVRKLDDKRFKIPWSTKAICLKAPVSRSAGPESRPAFRVCLVEPGTSGAWLVVVLGIFSAFRQYYLSKRAKACNGALKV